MTTTAQTPVHPQIGLPVPLPPPSRWEDWTAWVEFGRALADPQLWRRAPAAPVTPAAWPSAGIPMTVYGIREPQPGPAWRRLFEATWPAYRRWYLSRGSTARPDLATARQRLRTHMPELVPVWERLVDLADGDPDAARMLTLWDPPAYEAGCSQAIVPGPAPTLARNYDYHPELFEGVVASTAWGGRRVIGTSDCLWGLLDGMNDDGLVVSLTLGGRPGHGVGFGIGLVVRYLLQTCTDVPQAIAALRRLPVAQAYNIALVDTRGGAATVFVAPGEPAQVSGLRASTNHRLDIVEDPARAARLRSRERQDHLRALLDGGDDGGRDLEEEFLREPLYNRDFHAGFGTIYTVCYRPAAGTATYRWPGRVWERTFDSADDQISVELGGAEPAAA